MAVNKSISEIMLTKKEVVYKASGAISITNNINLLQRRAWNILLANAFDDLPDKEVYQVNLKDLCEVLDFDIRNQEYLKKTLKALMGCIVEWNVLGKDNKVQWGATTLLAQTEIKDGICTYAYSPVLRKRLHNPYMYARISLSMQNRFNSKHALVLYELCVDYFDIKRKWGETPFILIEKFRKLMGLKDTEYTDFKRLSTRIIREPIKEINEKSDLFVEIEYRREKRKVVAIKLHIRRNYNKRNLLNLDAVEEAQNGKLPDLDLKNQTLFDRLMKFGLTTKQAQKYSNEYDGDNAPQVLDSIEERFKKGEIKDVRAYTIASLKNSSQAGKTPLEIENEKQEELEKQKRAEAKKRMEIVKNLEKEFNLNKSKKVDNIIQGLPGKEKNRLITEFEDTKIKTNSFINDQYKQKGLKHIFIKGMFHDFIADRFLDYPGKDFIAFAKNKGYNVKKYQTGEYVLVSD